MAGVAGVIVLAAISVLLFGLDSTASIFTILIGSLFFAVVAIWYGLISTDDSPQTEGSETGDSDCVRLRTVNIEG